MKRPAAILGVLGLLLALAACQAAPPREPSVGVAHASSAGDESTSPSAAEEVADRVLARLGGRGAWERARYVSWVFFGGRRHLWDKWTGDIRVDDESSELTILMNVHTRTGNVRIRGRTVEDPALAADWLEKGYRWWINDSYWMFMPYKLCDPGVRLRSLGKGVLASDGRPAHVLELTFEGVGVTPENRYLVYVAEDTDLVEQWDFYATGSDLEPKFARPWAGWTPFAGSFGEIWLPHGGAGNDDWSVAVHEQIEDAVLRR